MIWEWLQRFLRRESTGGIVPSDIPPDKHVAILAPGEIWCTAEEYETMKRRGMVPAHTVINIVERKPCTNK